MRRKGVWRDVDNPHDLWLGQIDLKARRVPSLGDIHTKLGVGVVGQCFQNNFLLKKSPEHPKSWGLAA